MILTCPECATSYFVDDFTDRAAGRTVKCSNCGARWTALPGGEPKPPPRRPGAEARARRSPRRPPRSTNWWSRDRRRRPRPPRRKAPPTAKREANGKVLVWAASAVAAALLIAGAIAFRAQVVQLLPASQGGLCRARHAGLQPW